MPTDVAFTGQRSDSTGLMYFKARYYASSIGRFVSADTIVPNAGNPQAFNRYAYGLNNPVKYTDPTGHCSQNRDRDSECWDLVGEVQQYFAYEVAGLGGLSMKMLQSILKWIPQVTFDGDPWTGSNLSDVAEALNRVDTGLSSLNVKTAAALGLSRQKLIFRKHSTAPRTDTGAVTGLTSTPLVELWLTGGHEEYAIETAIHEMGHVVDWLAGSGGSEWSTTALAWWKASGWYKNDHEWWRQAPDRASRAATYYALENPREDFAETFAWTMESLAGNGYEDNGNFVQMPNGERLSALTVALKQIH